MIWTLGCIKKKKLAHAATRFIRSPLREFRSAPLATQAALHFTPSAAPGLRSDIRLGARPAAPNCSLRPLWYYIKTCLIHLDIKLYFKFFRGDSPRSHVTPTGFSKTFRFFSYFWGFYIFRAEPLEAKQEAPRGHISLPLDAPKNSDFFHIFIVFQKI